MKWPIFGLYSYRSVLELRDHVKLAKSSRKIKDLRPSISIMIIDDEKFQANTNLTTYGYNIREVPDINSVTDVEQFDIVLCDLMGVGKRFDHTLGGASIITEIKKNYPTKYVVAYTGARANSTEATVARSHADAFIKKDAEIAKWVEKLDEIIEEVADPYEKWLLARQGLIDNEIDLRNIVQLESAYVESIMSKDKSFTSIQRILDKVELSGNAKAIIQGLISSAIYTWMFG